MTPREVEFAVRYWNTDAGRAAGDKLAALLRRDWSVRVLDAWRDIRRQTREMRAVDMKRHTVALHFEGRADSIEYYTGVTEGAARNAAALAVFPTLPADVRAKLGECP